MDKLPLSATILVKNSETYLAQVLTSLREFDEVVLLDNGSTDNTLEIAKQFDNVSIYYHEFQGFGFMKNKAAELARNDWILNIDSDEVLTPELCHSLQAIDWSQTQCIYTILRLNHYRGRPIKACGWYPDILPRLYNRLHTRFTDQAVHERIDIPANSHVIALTGDLLHYSFTGAADLTAKMNRYTDLYAQEHRHRKQATIGQAVWHGIAAFVKSYVLKQGWRYGGDGLVISVGNAIGSYYKYVKLKEENEKAD